MEKNLIVKKLSAHFTVDNLRNAAHALSPTPQTDEGLALMNAVLQIPNDTEYIWLTALAALSIHDSKMAAALLQTATHLNGKPAITAIAQNTIIQIAIQSSKLTKADAGRALDATIESIKRKIQIIDELKTHFTIDNLVTTVNELNTRSPKDEGIDILWACLKIDAATDPLQSWFSAFAIICVHNPKLAEAILIKATVLSGNLPQNMNRAELIDAIASGSKLTKADAG